MISVSGLFRWASVALVVVVAARGQGRVLVIGVDGLDHAVCSRWIAEGRLPELAALARQGSFIPLRPTNPAQSPVSWATLTTGRNPGQTGVFDFLRRDFHGPDVTANLALVEPRVITPRRPFWIGISCAAVLGAVASAWSYRRRGRRAGSITLMATVMVVGSATSLLLSAIPAELTVPFNPRGGEATWERLDRAGVNATSLLAPMAFPAPKLDHGCLLCGLGVPDAMGTPGTVTVYREEPVPPERRITPTGCRVVPLTSQRDGSLGPVTVFGPKSPFTGERLATQLHVQPDREKHRVELRAGRLVTEVAENEWSDWLGVQFRLSPLLSVDALTRFRLLDGGQRMVLYQEPACFDARRQAPLAPITSPASFGSELAVDGAFDSLGWACATNPLQDEIIDEATFISDIEELDARREQMVIRSLERPAWREFFCVLSTPDRAQHLFWRDLDAEHPRHDAAALARRGDQILAAYRRVDALVGRIQREFVQPEDLLLVVSDHGFAPFRTAVNLNRWLAEEGLLVGSGASGERTIEQSIGGASLFPGVDWSKTKAYSLGLGKIYVNLRGREPSGSVDPAEREVVMADIHARLMKLRHEGRSVIHSVQRREDLYRGARVSESADLIIGFERGYRVSWQCTLGGLDEQVFEPNRNLWSGDHCSVDPDLVPGVLFSSRRLDQERADVADIHPTILSALGLPPTADLDGQPLKFKKLP